MKILMRADTHVSFSVPAEEPKAKCTNSQAIFVEILKIFLLKITQIEFLLGLGSFISINGFLGRWIFVSLHFTCS